jgi:hypothetical protein
MLEFKTKNNVNLNVTELDWSEARLLLQNVDAKLAAIIDSLPIGDDFAMYKATYPFGVDIIKNGMLYFSTTDGNSIAYNDINMPDNLVSKISYKKSIESPVGIVLDKTAEIYLTAENKPFPLKVLSPGSILGLSSIVNRNNINFYLNPFETTVAGARNSFMLAKISDVMRHRDLKLAYKISQNRPQSFHEHFLVFKDIAKAEKTNWHCEVLFFSNAALKEINTPSWVALSDYLSAKYIASSGSYRLVEWGRFLGYIEQKRTLRFTAPVLNLAKQLFAIANGDELCFSPAINDNSLPLNLIQYAYTHGYGLKDYSHIIMEPQYINPSQENSGYYFYNYSTLPQLEFEAPGTSKKSIMNFIKDVKFVIEAYQDSLDNNVLVEQSFLSYLSKIVEFSYYHDEPDSDKNIRTIDEFFNEDARFLYNQSGDFPRSSPMLRGCVKIAYKK